MNVNRTLGLMAGGALLGWAGLALFTYLFAPTNLASAAFVVLLLPVSFATLTVLLYAVHRRFARARNDQRRLSDAMRESFLLTALVGIWAGLRIAQILNWVTIWVMLGVVFLVEVWMFMFRRRTL